MSKLDELMAKVQEKSETFYIKDEDPDSGENITYPITGMRLKDVVHLISEAFTVGVAQGTQIASQPNK